MPIGAVADYRGPLAADRGDRRRLGIHLWWGPDGVVLEGWGVNEVPTRCPFRIGDWVVLHAYPAHRHPCDPWATGFRGVVLGAHGSTLLSGVTEDGRTWWEHWGALVPDGRPGGSAASCACCPDPDRWGEPDGQLDLFAAVSWTMPEVAE